MSSTPIGAQYGDSALKDDAPVKLGLLLFAFHFKLLFTIYFNLLFIHSQTLNTNKMPLFLAILLIQRVCFEW
jgi:hypothetical protein